MTDVVSILALVRAGCIDEDDGELHLMQCVDLETSRAIANWLALATDGPVTLRWVGIGVAVDIERTPEGVRAAMRPAG